MRRILGQPIPPVLIFIGLLFTCNGSFGAELKHVFDDSMTGSRFQTQENCQIIATSVDAHWCNPARLADNQKRLAQVELGARADEEAAIIVSNAMSKQPSKETVEALFRRKSFAAVSGYGRIETLARNVSISYTPMHLIGAYRITNPALPEISLHTLEQSTIRIQGALPIFSTQVLASTFKLDAGMSLYHFERNEIILEDQLIRVILNENAELGKQRRTRGLDTDAGLILRNDHFWFPDFAVKMSHLHHPYAISDHPENIDISSYLTRRSQLSVGKNFSLPLGTIGFESSLKVKNIFGPLESYPVSAGLQYSLGGLTAFLSASPIMESFGFIFDGPFYSVGIQYTDEKQPNDLQLSRQRMTYVYAKLQI